MAKTARKAVAPAPNGTPSKMDAVRRALAELGAEAMPLRIQQFVKERFGLDMTLNHVSNCKSEITRQATKGKGVAPKQPTTAKAAETGGGAHPAPGWQVAAKANGEGSQSSLPPAGSGTKTAGTKGAAKPVAKKPTTAEGGAVTTAPVKEAVVAPLTQGGTEGTTGGIRLEDVQTTRDLVNRVGAEQLRALIDLFAK